MRIYVIIAASLAVCGLLALGFINIQEQNKAEKTAQAATSDAPKDKAKEKEKAKDKAEAPKKKEEAPKKPKAIQEWKFENKGVKASGWRFPTGKAVASPEGLTYTQTGAVSTGPAVQGLALEAKAGQRFSVTLSAAQLEAAEKTPKALKGVQLFWATDEDVKAKEGQWAFSNEKVANLKVDPANPNQWSAQFYDKSWGGKIERIMVKPIFEEYISTPIPDGKSLEITIKGAKIEQ